MTPSAKKLVRLGLEHLETRLALAGKVTVTVEDHDLVIRGDVGANSIKIRQVDADSFTVTGLTQGGQATRINGAANATRPFHGVSDDIRVYLYGGADRVNMAGTSDNRLFVPDRLFINMGSGNDSLNLQFLTANDDVEVDTSSGQDYTYMWGVNAWDDLTVTNGSVYYFPGDFDRVYLYHCNSGNWTDSTLRIDMTAGKDRVYLYNTAADYMYVTMRGGDDYFSIAGGSAVRKQAGSSFSGGSGSDQINRWSNIGGVNSVPVSGFEVITANPVPRP